MKNNRNKKIIMNLIVVLIVVVSLSGCVFSDYGQDFTNMDDLKKFVSDLELTGIKYPSYLGETTKAGEKLTTGDKAKGSYYEYVCSKNGTEAEYVCYKLYHFSDYYAYSVYGFFETVTEYQLKSDKRAEFKEKIIINNIEVTVSTCNMTDDEQFIIFGYLENGRQTEIRISGRSKNTKVLYGNDNYKFAISEVEKIMKSFA